MTVAEALTWVNGQKASLWFVDDAVRVILTHDRFAIDCSGKDVVEAVEKAQRRLTDMLTVLANAKSEIGQ